MLSFAFFISIWTTGHLHPVKVDSFIPFDLKSQLSIIEDFIALSHSITNEFMTHLFIYRPMKICIDQKGEENVNRKTYHLHVIFIIEIIKIKKSFKFLL